MDAEEHFSNMDFTGTFFSYDLLYSFWKLKLQWWQTLACRGPSSLQNIEYKMWKMIFEVVAEPHQICARVLSFLQEFESLSVLESDAGWFSKRT